MSLNTIKMVDSSDAEMPQVFPLSPLLNINITKANKKKRNCEIETIILKTSIYFCKLHVLY